LSKHFPSFKENIDPHQMIEEEDADVTLRKSPDHYNLEQTSEELNAYPDEDNIPVF
jgi:hypothetical protein